MIVNSRRIVAHRVRRAWSQQHLADVANISLRTVQRIENSGHASPESLMAIAASLNTTPAELRRRPPSRRGLAALVGLGACAALALTASISVAEPLMLRVAISEHQQATESPTQRVVHLLADDGAARGLSIGPYQLEFVPSMRMLIIMDSRP